MASQTENPKQKKAFTLVVLTGVVVFAVVFALVSLVDYHALAKGFAAAPGSISSSIAKIASSTKPVVVPTLDTKAYDAKLRVLAHLPAVEPVSTSTATSTKPAKVPLWPIKTVYPNAGAILPFNRIVSYYGNFYSKQMGILGEFDKDTVLTKMRGEIKKWEAADPTTPVMPAIEYIAVTAQGSAGADGKYRLRMPDSQIDKAIEIAKEVNGIVILDIQVGLSTVAAELPPLEKYLAMPQVHLALDPEFDMKGGAKPGTVIGTMSATEINYAANYLADLVKKNNLPPKILIVHRFTQPMVTGYKNITPLPEVQIVMDMDGWGTPERKIDSYVHFVAPEPVQFTGIKLFYKNDLRPPSTRLLTTTEVLSLTPAPIFVQYQ